MLKKFMELFGAENLLDVAYETTIKMLEFDHRMYDASRHTLRETDTSELPFDIKETDRQINRYEREVRRNVLTHLSVAGTQNLVPGLALVSIVIDVERIGDYTKNIADLAARHPHRLQGGPFEDGLTKIETLIGKGFPTVIGVLKSQDRAEAREVMGREQQIAATSDQIVNDLISGKWSDIKQGDAVVLALYSRFLKRINAHLTNVASAIVNPFPRIGFREKPEPKSEG